MTTVPNGLAGGLVAAAVALAVARTLNGDSPPASDPSGSAEDGAVSRWLPPALALAYGSAAGGLLVALDLLVFGLLGVPPALGEAFAASVAWSAVLCLATASAALLAGNRGVSRGRLRRLVVFHLVYGLLLGAWIRLTWIT